MNFVVKSFILYNWIISIFYNWRTVVHLFKYVLQYCYGLGYIFTKLIEFLFFVLTSLLGYECLKAITHLKESNHLKKYFISVNDKIPQCLEEHEVGKEVDKHENNELYKEWIEDESVKKELNHFNTLLLTYLFSKNEMSKNLMNENIFTNTREIIQSIESKLLLRLASPDLFYRLLRGLLTLSTDQLHIYHEMREIAASNNHSEFFAKKKNCSYNPKDIPGFYNESNLENRNHAIEEEYKNHQKYHPALVDEECTILYLRYLSQQIYQQLDLSSSSLLFRDLLCDFCVSSILLPFLSSYTPQLANQFLYLCISHSLQQQYQTKLIDLLMSSELQAQSSLTDPYQCYVSTSLSRYQCENLLLRSPHHSFLFRLPNPYSQYFILSYYSKNHIIHEFYLRKDTGYEREDQLFHSYEEILKIHQKEILYGIRLNEKNQVVGIDTMPWYTTKRVKEHKKHSASIDDSGKEIQLATFSSSYEIDKIPMNEYMNNMNQANYQFKRRHFSQHDYLADLSLSWMSGLDEVEEWLRERSVLLQTFEEYGKQLISYYMKNSERNLTDDIEIVHLFIQSLLDIIEYNTNDSIPGIWILFEKANIPSKLVRYSADNAYCKRCIYYLLNIHQCYSFFSSLSFQELQVYYQKSSILLIQANRKQFLSTLSCVNGIEFALSLEEKLPVAISTDLSSEDFSLPADFPSTELNIFGTNVIETTTTTVSTSIPTLVNEKLLFSSLMNEIQYFSIRNYHIKWNNEENRNIVLFDIEVFTTTKKWIVSYRYSILLHFHQTISSLLPPNFPSFPPKYYNKKSNYDDSFLKIRCIQLNQYFNSLLNIQSIRNLDSFQALFFPVTDIEDLPSDSEDEEETSEPSLPPTPMVQEEDDDDLQQYQDLYDLIYQFTAEFFQLEDPSKVKHSLFRYFDKLACLLSYGSLLSFYRELQATFTSSSTVAFLIGSLRMTVFSKEFFFFSQTDSLCDKRSLRKLLLSSLPPKLIDVLSKSETARRCRLSIMCGFEFLQSKRLCFNQAMHTLDLIISLLFPEIEVWSSLDKQ